jgi:hypothetical protein
MLVRLGSIYYDNKNVFLFNYWNEEYKAMFSWNSGANNTHKRREC